MNKKSAPASNMGTVSLLMTFIVLCLVVFATLSLSNTVSEYRYSEKLAENDAAYYEAEEAATALLRRTDEALHTAALTFSKEAEASETEYYALVKEALADTVPEAVFAAKNGKEAATVSYDIGIDDTHVLAVTLELHDPQSTSDGYYRIAEWRKVSAAEWNAAANPSLQ